VGDDIQRSVFGANLIFETLGALSNRSDVNRRRDDGYITLCIGIRPFDRVGKNICGEPPGLSVVRNDEANAIDSSSEPIPTIFAFLAAFSIGFLTVSERAGAMTIAGGFDAITVSSMPTWPSASDSESIPSSMLSTPRSCPALRAPLSTVCQKAERLSLTMTGIVDLVYATPTPAVTDCS
jgi:hypothetical protein